MIVFDDNLEAIWFLAGKSMDWNCAVMRRPEERVVRVCYRFRYYDKADPDNDAWSGKDRKSWTVLEGPQDEAGPERAIEGCDYVFRQLQAVGFNSHPDYPVYRLVRTPGMTTREMAEEYKRQPFVHTRQEQRQ